MHIGHDEKKERETWREKKRKDEKKTRGWGSGEEVCGQSDNNLYTSTVPYTVFFFASLSLSLSFGIIFKFLICSFSVSWTPKHSRMIKYSILATISPCIPRSLC
jgi:hypothetical protein